MRPFATPPATDCYDTLPLADFADAFSMAVLGPVDAPQAADRAFARMPGWVQRLLALRNGVVRHLGLRTDAGSGGARFGMFPVISSTPERVVLGFDDWHLDFRIVLDVRGQQVTLTTLVQRHGLAGRVYLAAVMPFHRRIVPAILARVA